MKTWLHNLRHHSRLAMLFKLRAFIKRGGGWSRGLCWCGKVTELHDGKTPKHFWCK